MPIHYSDNDVVLEGDCTIEEVEPLLAFLEQHPDATLNLTRCEHLHTAVLQTLLAYRVPLKGEVFSPFLWKWIAPLLRRGDST